MLQGKSTGLQRSDKTGDYRIASLPVGTYDVTV